MIKAISILFLLALVLSSCKKDNDKLALPCQQEVIMSEELYLTAPSDHLVIDSLKIEGNCLRIDFSSSGCNGDSWELKLIDSGAVMESYPPQRNVRLSLKNEELCDAWFVRQISFDISALQVDGGPVYLNLTNTDQKILYEY